MGVQIGLRDLHYALLQDDDIEVGAVYDEPVRIIGAIQANINPNASRETLFADDGPMETASSLGEIELEMVAADIPLQHQAALLGHDINEEGIMESNAESIPPWVAVGFRSLKSDGSYRYVWLLKGKFQEPEASHETKGDTITFQTPTMNGGFVKRDCDDLWKLTGDEDEVTFTDDETTWFVAARINKALGEGGEEPPGEE